MDIIKVSGSSRTASVAGCNASAFRQERLVHVQAVSAKAVHQAVKAIILAKGYIENDSYAIMVLPEFVYITINGRTVTAIRFVIALHENGTGR